MPQTVLVVDDDPLTRRLLQYWLQRDGYQMIGVNNGREAVSLAKSQMPQLIILDVMMPDLDGWSVLRQIRDSEATRTIPVILLSGNADFVANDESVLAGAALLMIKPINAQQLLSGVKRLLSGQRPEGPV